MKSPWPLIITAFLCIGITLLISYLIWGPGDSSSKSNIQNTGLTEAARKGKAAIVFIYTVTSDTTKYYTGNQTGSGVIISSDGYIVTNYHVIAGTGMIHVQLDDHRERDATIVGIDSTHDVALLKINATDLPSLEFGNSDSLHIGEPVLAVGNPYRLQSTVTAGIISALGRDIDLANNKTRNFIQTDVPINLGNSGGALLNYRGQLMGLNIAYMSVSGAYEGFSFALPSNLVKKITEDLGQYGSLQRVNIGMNIRPVTESIAYEEGMNSIYGVVVDALTPDGTADKAGIQSLDILLTIDTHRIESSSDFISQLQLYRPGDIVSVTLLRNKKEETVKVKLEKTDKE